MAPVIWGLDLSEMQWGKFKSSYMFNKVYHLRRTKMVVYQIAMIFCVVSESLGTAALSHYVDQEDGITSRERFAGEFNNDFIGIMAYNIFVGVSIATIFGAAFFFDLFWPERHESKSVRLAWKICSVLACILAFGDAVAMTVIVATQSAHVSGVDEATKERIIDQNKKPTLIYRKNAYAITSVVFLWIGLCATTASTIILWKSHQHDDEFGPKSTHIREKEAAEPDVESSGEQTGHTTRVASEAPQIRNPQTVTNTATLDANIHESP